MTTTRPLDQTANRVTSQTAARPARWQHPPIARLDAEPAYRRQWSGTLTVGLLLVLALTAVALLAPHIAPYDIAKMSPADRLQAPSAAHPFGTDAFGRDLFSRVLFGTRISLTVAGLAVLLAAVPGILLGILAGLHDGLIESFLTRLMDAWIAVPSLLLAIVMAATLGRTAFVLALALALSGLPTYYRQARAETLLIRASLYVDAARSLGGTEGHIVRRHILPNVLPALLVLVSLRIGAILLAVSALGFIGLGVQPPEPEWGALMAEGRNYLNQAWWLIFFPGMAIALTAFGLNMLGDGLRDFMDPRHPATYRPLSNGTVCTDHAHHHHHRRFWRKNPPAHHAKGRHQPGQFED